MKIIQAENIKNVLETMLDTKGIVGFKIARNLRMINEELKEYYDVKLGLFKKYGSLKEDGSYAIETKTENFDNFIADITPFAEQEVEFNFRKITEDELANSELTAEQMSLIWDFMVEEDKE